MKHWIYTFIPSLLVQHVSESAKLEKIYHAKFLQNSIEGDSSVYTFETLLKVSVQQCVNACKTTKACEYINYERRYTKCDLLCTKDDTETKKVKLEAETKPGCVFGNKSEWIEMSSNACDHCGKYGKCSATEEIKRTICRNSGCGKPNGYDLKGNMLSYGNKIIVANVNCNDGETRIPQSHYVNASVCFENGTWSYHPYVCLKISEFNGSFYYIHPQLMNWHEAKAYCESLIGHLVDINTEEEQRFIETLLVDEYGVKTWIGGNDFLSPGEFRWSDGSRMLYKYWLPRSPDSPTSHCVDVAGHAPFPGWRRVDCDEESAFMCEFD